MKRMVLIYLGMAAAVGSAAGAGETSGSRRADQEALKVYGALVGPGKGVGQPQRNNPKGAWVETGEWVWKLTPDSAALELVLKGGKYLKAAELRPGKDPGTFLLNATLADDTKRTFTGKPGALSKLVLVADGPPAEGVRRLTLSPLHDTRFLMLIEAQDPANERFYRLAEVGYTRQGVAFAAGESYPLCIVTDGRGSIEVKYQGKSYWVCCSGCRDLFNENPAEVIAEAEARRKAKNAEK